jgi:hypothetical protein
MGKSFDSLCIVLSFGRTLSVRLGIIGTTVVIVPFFTLLLFKVLTLLMSIFNTAVGISVVDGIAQISVIPVSSLAVFLRWSETTSRDSVRTLPVVMLMTPCFIVTVECQVSHDCCIQHHLEARHMCVDFSIWPLWPGGWVWHP